MGTSRFDSLTKQELHALADTLLEDSPEGVEQCVAFVEAETGGHWHGRARAMMCRRLKHCQLTRQQVDRLTAAILDRLKTGRFSEQFRDQLRLVLHFDPEKAFEVAPLSETARADHVRRFSRWILSHRPEDRAPGSPAGDG